MLEQARASDKMEETEIVTLFGPIERLYRVAKLFLRQLEERFYVWEEAGQDHIGDLFRDWVHSLPTSAPPSDLWYNVALGSSSSAGIRIFVLICRFREDLMN